MAKQNQTNKKNDKTQLSATTPPLGCAILFFLFFGFFMFLVFKVFGFFVFWFVVGFFEGLAKQH